MTHTPSKKGFEQVFDLCEMHGKYPLNFPGEDGYGDRWAPDGCPKCREQNKVKNLLLGASIPVRFIECNFDNFITENQDQKRVLDRCKSYAENFESMRAEGANLLLCGNVGTGKNHLATSIARTVISQGFTALLVKANDFLEEFWARSFEERRTWMRSLGAVDFLVLDELGRASSTKAAQDAFFRLLDSRYEAKLPTMICTNLSRDELMGSEVLGPAAFDRLTQGKSIRLTLKWESYRTKAS